MTKIVLADDHAIVRDGLRSLLEKRPDVEVVGEADNGRTTVQLAKDLKPDVIIMDVSMPDLNGVDATRQILADDPEARVIGLSMYSDRRFVTGMLKAGAAGYILKDSAFDELAHAISTVLDGQTYLSPRITDVVVKHYVRDTSEANESLLSALTDREREVLQLLAEGKSTKEIAADLYVSVKTVETHRQRIMGKLNLHTVPDLTKFAIREGLTSLGE